MSHFKKSPYYKKINKLLNRNIQVNWPLVFVNAIKSYRFLSAFDKQHDLNLKLSYKLWIAVYTSLVLQKRFTRESMKLFIGGITLIIIWDDYYDHKNLTLDELQGIRKQVFNGEQYLHEIAQKLLLVYTDIFVNFIWAKSELKMTLFEDFHLAFNALLDGFEYEYMFDVNNITPQTLVEYLNHVQTIGFPCTLRLLAMAFVHTEIDYEQFIKIYPFELKASLAIRLTNDIVGYERDLKIGEEEPNYILLREMVCGEILEEATENSLKIIYECLLDMKEIFRTENKYTTILRNVVFLAIKQYFVKDLIH